MSFEHQHDYMTIEELTKEAGHRLESVALASSPNSVRIAAWFFTVILLGFILALIFVPWQQAVVGEGKVIAYSPNERQQRIDAPVEGRISHWHVYEGDFVNKGQPIADILDIDPQKLERLEREREAAQIKLEAAQQALLTSNKNLERQKILAEKGLSSQRSYELAQLEYAKFQSDVSSATSEMARIEVRIAQQSSQTVTAPRDGVVMRVVAPQGQVIVKAGDPIALLVPETKDRAVELLVDGNDLPLISVGRQVRLQFEGWPAIQFVGFPSVAVGTFSGVVGVIDASDDGSGRFRIIVFPDGEEKWPDGIYLRQGVRVIGWVLLDTVKLGWELWRQFNGFPQSVSQPPTYQQPRTRSGDSAKKAGQDEGAK